MHKRIVFAVTICLILAFYGFVGVRWIQWEQYGKKDYFRKQGIEGMCNTYKAEMKEWKRKHSLPWMWGHDFKGSVDEWFPE